MFPGLAPPFHAAERAARLYRERDGIMVREMTRHRHDFQGIRAAREAHRSLDEVMRCDIKAGQKGEG